MLVNSYSPNIPELCLNLDQKQIISYQSNSYDTIYLIKVRLKRIREQNFFDCKILAIFDRIKLSSATKNLNSVLFIQLTLWNQKSLFQTQKIEYITANYTRKCIIPQSISSINVSITLLPFKPMIFNQFPRFSACINSCLSLCPHITACLNSFPLVKFMISSQNTENFSISDLFSIFPNNFADTDIKDDILCFVTQFCNECGFEIETLNFLPDSMVNSENDPDIIVCLPELSEKSLIEDIIAIPKKQYYKIISIILEENGVLYTNINTSAGSFKISNNGIAQTDHFTKSSDISQKYIALIYARTSIFEFAAVNILWPYPIFKNPDLLKIEQKSLIPAKIEQNSDYFYFSYNKKHEPYPSIPSRFVRSQIGILMPVQPKGQLIWCQELNKDPYPKYLIGKKMKVSDIIRNSEISNSVLVKMSGKCILSSYNTLEDEEIQFPTENLLVIEKHKIETPDPDKKKTYLVSYAKQEHIMNIFSGNSIESSILQYYLNPQVFESLKDALEYSKIITVPNKTGFYLEESDSSYVFIVNSKMKWKKARITSNDFYNLNSEFIYFVVVHKLQNSTNKKA